MYAVRALYWKDDKMTSTAHIVEALRLLRPGPQHTALDDVGLGVEESLHFAREIPCPQLSPSLSSNVIR
jgi:hypothetical protein